MDISTTSVVYLATTLAALIFLYKYLTREFGYWTSQGVPSDKPYPLFGTEFSMFTKPVHEIDLERSRKHGRIFGSYMFTRKIFNVFDPDILKHILVKDFNVFVNRNTLRTGVQMLEKGLIFATNDDWKRLRSIVSPTFSSGKIKKMTFLIKDVAKTLTQEIIIHAEKGEPINMKKEASKYSIEVIGACVFGIRLDSFINQDHPFIVNSEKFFNGGLPAFLTFLAVTLLPPAVSGLKNKIMKVMGITFFIEFAKEIIYQRRTDPTQKNVDFLQLLIDAKEETVDNVETDQHEMSKKDIIKNIANKSRNTTWTKTLNEDEIVAQCATFLFAGQDTVASAISFVAYNLALHLDVQEKLLQEIDDVWEKHGDIDHDAINQMPYLHAVVSETLRLHTLAPRVMRQAKEDYQIPNTNIIIPKDTVVQIPTYALHHDPEFFPDPEKFDPDRFLPENKENIIPYTYMPFSDGPRNCIAMRFALINVKFCLAYLLRFIKVSPTEETKKPLKYFLGGQVLVAKQGIIVQPEKRRNLE